jgi:23S rRNA A2030 N6-methylase RlmJ
MCAHCPQPSTAHIITARLNNIIFLMGVYMGRKIRIDLNKLYWLTDKVSNSSAELLRKILNYYNLNYDVIYAESPDVERTIVLKKDAYTIEFVDTSADEIRKKLKKECKEVIVELFDGYETAFTCINH